MLRLEDACSGSPKGHRSNLEGSRGNYVHYPMESAVKCTKPVNHKEVELRGNFISL